MADNEAPEEDMLTLRVKKSLVEDLNRMTFRAQKADLDNIRLRRELESKFYSVMSTMPVAFAGIAAGFVMGWLCFCVCS